MIMIHSYYCNCVRAIIWLCLSQRILISSNTDHVTKGTANTLGYNIPFEQPVVLQLGGSDEDTIKRACQLALPFGFYEFNLNVGWGRFYTVTLKYSNGNLSFDVCYYVCILQLSKQQGW